MQTVAVFIALLAAANANSLAFRVPSADSTVISSQRVGGNFAYSTSESAAFGIVNPIVSHIASPFAATYAVQVQQPTVGATWVLQPQQQQQQVVQQEQQQIVQQDQEQKQVIQEQQIVQQPTITVQQPSVGAIWAIQGQTQPIVGATWALQPQQQQQQQVVQQEQQQIVQQDQEQKQVIQEKQIVQQPIITYAVQQPSVGTTWAVQGQQQQQQQQQQMIQQVQQPITYTYVPKAEQLNEVKLDNEIKSSSAAAIPIATTYAAQQPTYNYWYGGNIAPITYNTIPSHLGGVVAKNELNKEDIKPVQFGYTFAQGTTYTAQPTSGSVSVVASGTPADTYKTVAGASPLGFNYVYGVGQPWGFNYNVVA